MNIHLRLPKPSRFMLDFSFSFYFPCPLVNAGKGEGRAVLDVGKSNHLHCQGYTAWVWTVLCWCRSLLLHLRGIMSPEFCNVWRGRRRSHCGCSCLDPKGQGTQNTDWQWLIGSALWEAPQTDVHAVAFCFLLLGSGDETSSLGKASSLPV